jgi:hypothetical protein
MCCQIWPGAKPPGTSHGDTDSTNAQGRTSIFQPPPCISTRSRPRPAQHKQKHVSTHHARHARRRAPPRAAAWPLLSRPRAQRRRPRVGRHRHHQHPRVRGDSAGLAVRGVLGLQPPIPVAARRVPRPRGAPRHGGRDPAGLPGGHLLPRRSRDVHRRPRVHGPPARRPRLPPLVPLRRQRRGALLRAVRGDGGEAGGARRGRRVVAVHAPGPLLGAAGWEPGGQREGDEERGQHQRAALGRPRALPLGRRGAVRAGPADAGDHRPVRHPRQPLRRYRRSGTRRQRRGCASRAPAAVAAGGRDRRGRAPAATGPQWSVPSLPPLAVNHLCLRSAHAPEPAVGARTREPAVAELCSTLTRPDRPDVCALVSVVWLPQVSTACRPSGSSRTTRSTPRRTGC